MQCLPLHVQCSSTPNHTLLSVSLAMLISIKLLVICQLYTFASNTLLPETQVSTVLASSNLVASHSISTTVKLA